MPPHRPKLEPIVALVESLITFRKPDFALRMEGGSDEPVKLLMKAKPWTLGLKSMLERRVGLGVGSGSGVEVGDVEEGGASGVVGGCCIVGGRAGEA